MSDFYPEETILCPMTYQDAILILQNVNPERGDIWSQMEKELRKWVRENGAEMFEILAEHKEEILAAAFPDEKSELKSDPAFPNGRAAEFAAEIVKFLKENHLWLDVRVYFNRMCFATDNGKGIGTLRESRTETNGPLYFIPDIDPRDYFQYVNPNHILSMSFEGPFYECLNGYAGDYGYEIEAEFRQLLQKYGCYYELGDAWNLSVYKL